MHGFQAEVDQQWDQSIVYKLQGHDLLKLGQSLIILRVVLLHSRDILEDKADYVVDNDHRERGCEANTSCTGVVRVPEVTVDHLVRLS